MTTAYNLTENERDRFIAKITATYDELWICHVIKVEQELVFFYQIHALRDERSDLWVVAYTERVIRVCPVVLIVAYEKYRLWYVTLDVIAFA